MVLGGFEGSKWFDVVSGDKRECQIFLCAFWWFLAIYITYNSDFYYL